MWFFQAFGRIIVEQKGGSLIACSSVRAVTIEPGLAVYGSTKAAIGLLAKGSASEVGRSGVGVNAIAPSIAETVLTGPFKQRPDIYNLYAGHTVFDRWSSADEVATAVAYLASDAASYVSGSTLFVDGGWTATARRPGSRSCTNHRKPARARCSRASALVSSSISAWACSACAALVVTPAVYMVASSQPFGSDPDSSTPLVEMISVDCVQPIGRFAVRRRKLPHRRRAIRIDFQPHGDFIGDTKLRQYLGDMNAGGRGLDIRYEDRIRRKKRRAQIIGIPDRDLGIAAAHRERRLDHADIGDGGRARQASPQRASPPALSSG